MKGGTLIQDGKAKMERKDGKKKVNNISARKLPYPTCLLLFACTLKPLRNDIT